MVEQGAKELVTVQFEVAIAASGIIAPKLFTRLRKAENERQRNNAILLTDMSFKDNVPTSYTPLHSRDPEEDLFIGANGNDDGMQ